jgi:hypothetical protein
VNPSIVRGLGYIALAGLLGYAKKRALPRSHTKSRTKSRSGKSVSGVKGDRWVDRKLLAPIREEATFSQLGAGPLRAAAFAGAHLLTEDHTVESALFRGVDTFIGGLIYGQATRDLGLLGGIAAHVLHNIASDL